MGDFDTFVPALWSRDGVTVAASAGRHQRKLTVEKRASWAAVVAAGAMAICVSATAAPLNAAIGVNFKGPRATSSGERSSFSAEVPHGYWRALSSAIRDLPSVPDQDTENDPPLLN
jgi:hypothetical protein